MKKPLLLLTFLLAIIFSCRRDNPPSASECAGATINWDFLGVCGEYENDSLFCVIEDMGRFHLEENSKSFQPLYCKPIGQFIRYKNQKGEPVFLKIADKSFILTRSSYWAYPPCENDSTKRKFYCLQFEEMWVTLESEEKDWRFVISIKTIPDLVNPGNGRVGDFIEIQRRESLLSWYTDLSAVVSQRSLSFSRTPTQEHYDTIELLGTSFQNVISNDLQYYLPPRPFKFYYNAQDGLVGFIDQDEVLWRIDD